MCAHQLHTEIHTHTMFTHVCMHTSKIFKEEKMFLIVILMMCGSMCGAHTCWCPQRLGTSDPLELKLQVVVHHQKWVGAGKQTWVFRKGSMCSELLNDLSSSRSTHLRGLISGDILWVSIRYLSINQSMYLSSSNAPGMVLGWVWSSVHRSLSSWS